MQTLYDYTIMIWIGFIDEDAYFVFFFAESKFTICYVDTILIINDKYIGYSYTPMIYVHNRHVIL